MADMKPEDVKPVLARELEFRGIAGHAPAQVVGKFIPAHEVGAIIKAAMGKARLYERLQVYGLLSVEVDEYAAWLAKADELEKME